MTVNAHHRARAIMRQVQLDLNSLAIAFDRTGNTTVADELDTIRQYLIDAQEMYADAYDTLQKQTLADTSNTVGGLLSVAVKIDELTNKSK